MAKLTPEALRTFLDASLDGGAHVDDPDLDMATRKVAQDTGELITAAISYLATVFANERINQHMTRVWHLVGSNTTPAALHQTVRTVSFLVVGRTADTARGVLLVPPAWSEMCVQDPILQIGALVFCGSQAIDFYNNKIRDEATGRLAERRALAYEAEFLLTVKTTQPGWKPTEYQKKVMAEFPQGLDSPGVRDMLYKSIPVPVTGPGPGPAQA